MPDLLVFTTLQPIMFVLLFAYVFGGAINVQGSSYKEFLIAGIFTQTVTFGATLTGAGLADDMQKGIIDRFRSLPMSRSAVLVGRTVSDVANNLLVVVVMSLTGLVVGWRIRSSVADAIIGYALLLLWAYAFSWIMAYVGLLAPSPEVVNNAAFIVIFPITFISNAFVPLESLSGVLKTFAAWNPLSAVTQACREWFGNIPANVPDAGLLVAAARHDLLADLDHRHPGDLRAAGHPPVQPRGQPVVARAGLSADRRFVQHVRRSC